MKQWTEAEVDLREGPFFLSDHQIQWVESTLPSMTLDEKIEMIKTHAELLSQIKPEEVAMHKMRTHTAYYLKGGWKSSEIKPKIFKMNTKEELFDLLEEYVKLVS